MKISILSPWKQAADIREREEDYLKRLRRYASVTLEEIKGAKGEEKEAVRKEGEFLLAKFRRGSYIVALTESGKNYDSRQFSQWLEGMGINGRSDITFVIGGAAGLSRDLLEKADGRLSLSAMTFPHQMARLVLVEQIYRAFTLIKGEPYHK
ncbi:MAG: 23S rRNA (pseudouridine(1915)-N(3))-methyltransferase RlmH [Proteobacteria bacterium]|nr:23S rRNA (pseudouridine(1915)-N(3))-methyltransferase RlmH [Pseudomonadota bacterium]